MGANLVLCLYHPMLSNASEFRANLRWENKKRVTKSPTTCAYIFCSIPPSEELFMYDSGHVDPLQAHGVNCVLENYSRI